MGGGGRCSPATASLPRVVGVRDGLGRTDAYWAARALQGVGAAFIVTGGFALIATVYVQAKARTRAFALAWCHVRHRHGAWSDDRRPCLIVDRLALDFPHQPASLRLGRVGRTAAGRGGARGSAPAARPPGCHVVYHPRLLCWSRRCCLAALRRRIWPAGLALSAVFLAAFAIQQRRRDKPILDPGVFVQRAMIGIAILLFAVSIGYWAVLVYLPLFFAAAFDWSSEVAGIALLTATLPMLFLPPLGGRLVGRLGWRLHFALALAIRGGRQCHHCDRAYVGRLSAADDFDLLRHCRHWGWCRARAPATVRRSRRRSCLPIKPAWHLP